MATTPKHRRGKVDSLRQDPKTKRFHWAIFKRGPEGHVFRNSKGEPTGNLFRRAGHRADRQQALADQEVALQEYYRQLREPSPPPATKHTIETWGKTCEEDIWPREVKVHLLQQTTLDAYRYALANHVYLRLGSVRLSQLTRGDIKGWIADVQEAHGVNVARNALTVLKSILVRAVDAEEIPSTPADRLTIKKPRMAGGAKGDDEPGKMFLTAEQEKALMAAAVGTCMELPIYLGRAFGLRIGECLGLRWQDVDFEVLELRVNQQAQYHVGCGVQITATKSSHSDRTISIPPSCVEYLTKAKARAMRSKSLVERTFVCTRNGQLLGSKKHPLYMSRVAKAAGFKKVEEGGMGVPTHHDLRTTFISDLARKGVLPHTLRDLAGHSSVLITEKFYTRSDAAEKKSAMDLVTVPVVA